MGPTNRRKDLGRGRKCPVKAVQLEPWPPVPEETAGIGVYFSDQVEMIYPSRDAYLLIDS